MSGVDGGRKRGGDGVTNAPGVGASLGGVRFVLPSGLASRFEVVKELGRGAQAVLWLVRDRECGGEPRVLKVYLVQGGGLDLVALEMVREASRVGASGHGHLVELFEHGEVGGHVFEVMEYCPADSLARLLASEGPVLAPELVLEVVREVAGALVFLHGLQADGRPVVHKDVKPANVLVRSREGLDLVLCDYGLSRALSQTVEFRSAGRTPLYAPPEAAHGVVSPAWDWWSLGVIVVEMCTGRHPFVSAGGLVDYDVLTGVAQVDLSGVADDRLRLLCAGLLTRDSGDRWGGVEVGEWLAEDRPDPPVKESTVSRTAAGQVQPFVFSDGSESVSYADPVLLAKALAVRWEEACAIVANTTKARMDHKRLRGFVDSAALKVAAGHLDSSGVDPDLRLTRFLCALDPDFSPQFRGYDLSGNGLAALALEAASGESEALEALSVLAREPVLTSFEAVAPGFAEYEHRWERETSRLKDVIAAPGDGHDERAELEEIELHLSGELLAAISDAESERRLDGRVEEALNDRDALEREWFSRLARSTTGSSYLADRLVAVVLRPLASRQTRMQPVFDLEAEMERKLSALPPVTRQPRPTVRPQSDRRARMANTRMLLNYDPYQYDTARYQPRRFSQRITDFDGLGGAVGFVASVLFQASFWSGLGRQIFGEHLNPILAVVLFGLMCITLIGVFGCFPSFLRTVTSGARRTIAEAVAAWRNRASSRRDRQRESLRASYLKRIAEARERAELAESPPTARRIQHEPVAPDQSSPRSASPLSQLSSVQAHNEAAVDKLEAGIARLEADIAASAAGSEYGHHSNDRIDNSSVTLPADGEFSVVNWGAAVQWIAALRADSLEVSPYVPTVAFGLESATRLVELVRENDRDGITALIANSSLDAEGRLVGLLSRMNPGQPVMFRGLWALSFDGLSELAAIANEGISLSERSRDAKTVGAWVVRRGVDAIGAIEAIRRKSILTFLDDQFELSELERVWKESYDDPLGAGLPPWPVERLTVLLLDHAIEMCSATEGESEVGVNESFPHDGEESPQ